MPSRSPLSLLTSLLLVSWTLGCLLPAGVRAHENVFSGDRIVNRSELIQVLVGLEFGEQRVASMAGRADPLYRDVAAGTSLDLHLQVAFQEGIVRRLPTHSYHPEKPVTFLQAAKVLARTVGRHVLDPGSKLEEVLSWLDQRQAIPPTVSDLRQPLSQRDLAEILFRLKRSPRGLASMRFDPRRKVLWRPVEEGRFYLPILMFHHILDLQEGDPAYGLSLAPERLENFLAYLREEKVETLTYRDLQEIREGRREYPERAVMLTFDDGYLEHFTQAFPLLQRYGAKGNFAISTQWIRDDGRHMTWDQVQALARAGHGICSHSRTHRDLSTLSEKQLRREIVETRRLLEEKTGVPVLAMVYPAGSYDAEVLEITEEAGYSFARTTRAGKVVDLSSRFELPTVRVHPTTSVASLRRWLRPAHFRPLPEVPRESEATVAEESPTVLAQASLEEPTGGE